MTWCGVVKSEILFMHCVRVRTDKKNAEKCRICMLGTKWFCKLRPIGANLRWPMLSQKWARLRCIKRLPLYRSSAERSCIVHTRDARLRRGQAAWWGWGATTSVRSDTGGSCTDLHRAHTNRKNMAFTWSDLANNTRFSGIFLTYEGK